MQGCTEMIQPEMKNDNNSLFPYTFKHKITDMGCSQFFGIHPRPHWITTEFGGEVSLLNFRMFYIFLRDLYRL